MTLSTRTRAFEKEPVLDGKSITRGYLNCIGIRETGFLIDNTSKQLYVDLNTNGDLTDDPVYLPDPSEKNETIYKGIKVYLIDRKNGAPILLNLSNPRPQFATATVQSCWQGKIDLDGRSYEIAIVDQPNEYQSNQRMLLRHWEDRMRPFHAESCFIPPENLLFEGHAFHVKTVYLPGSHRYNLELTEVEAHLATVSLTGDYIEQVVLRRQRGNPMTVVLNGSAPQAVAPEGEYILEHVWLRNRDSEAFGATTKLIAITAGRTNILEMGGPLSNSISIKNNGRSFNLGYKLVGMDEGIQYTLPTSSQKKPPKFTITQAGKEVASGTFEFG